MNKIMTGLLAAATLGIGGFAAAPASAATPRATITVDHIASGIEQVQYRPYRERYVERRGPRRVRVCDVRRERIVRPNGTVVIRPVRVCRWEVRRW